MSRILDYVLNTPYVRMLFLASCRGDRALRVQRLTTAGAAAKMAIGPHYLTQWLSPMVDLLEQLHGAGISSASR